jgi:hypothetical protein
MACKTFAIYFDVTYYCIFVQIVVILECLLMDLAQKKKVDNSGFPKDTRHTFGVVWLLCAAIRCL